MANHEGSWRVSFNRVSTSITSSCRKFETFGILCSHALKVFEFNDVKVIPEKYILRRWTREARCGDIVQDFRGKEGEGDPKLSMKVRKTQEGGVELCSHKNVFVPYVEELFSGSESEVIQSLSEFRVVCSG